MAAARTTRYWLRVGTAGASAVLAALAALAVAASSHASDATHAMTDRDSPALTAAVNLEAALVNQETGVRGYGLAGTVDFLQPYHQGVIDEQTAVASLRSLNVGGTQGQQQLNAVLVRAQVWQTFYARPIADAAPADARSLSDERLDQAKAQFDALRAAMSVQQDQLQRTREASRQDLADAERLRDQVFIAAVLAIAVMILLVFEGLRRGVTRPLARLSADARRVTAGELDHLISPSGPADLRALAGDVEAMRRRLVDELAAVENSRRLLDEQASDLERSNTELEQFAYVASHDLQEPLRKVASFCQLLQRRYAEQLDERANQYIEFAVDGANRMQTLIQDLLAFSRVGRTFDADGVVDLETVFDQVLDNLSIAIEEAGAHITHDRLPVVRGDQTQLGMALQNLVSNAVKFRHPERAPRIEITVARVKAEDSESPGAVGVAASGDTGAARPEDQWEIVFDDNGIGIPAEYADRVFTIFQRLHSRDAYPGNGIGLAICRKIVELHGGRITIDTERPIGTRILVTLPVREVEPDDPGDTGDPGDFSDTNDSSADQLGERTP